MAHLINIIFICFFLFFFYSIGYLLNYFTKVVQTTDKPYYSIFNNLVFGLVFSVSLTACIFTGFVTTSMLFLFIFGYIIFLNKAKVANYHFYFKKLYPLPFFVLVGYSLSVFKGYNLEGTYTQNLFIDYIFYKQVIFNLINGQENVSEWANILDKDYDGISPYHYFELWLTVLLSKTNKLPVLLNFTVYIPTLFISIILFGSVSILENSKNIRIIHLLFATALLFVGQIYLPFYESFFWSGYQHVFTSVGYIPVSEKLFPFALFGIASFSAFEKKRYSLFLCYLLFLSIASFVATPAVFGAMYFLLLFNLYFKVIKDKRIYLLSIFPIIYTIFLILFKQSFDGYVEKNYQFDFSIILQSFTIKNIITFSILRPSYFLLPVLLLSALLFIKNKLKFVNSFLYLSIFYVGLIGGCSLIAIFYSSDPNAIQLINLPLYGFSFATIIWLISKLDKKMYLSFILVGSMILINFYYNYNFFYEKLNHNKPYSDKYIAFITNQLPDEKPTPIAAFFSLETPFNFEMFNNLGREVAYLDNVGLIRMINTTFEERESINSFNVNIFYKFIRDNNYSLENEITEAQIVFFKENKIRHLLIQRGEKISPKIENLITESYTDSVSGNRFCIINFE